MARVGWKEKKKRREKRSILFLPFSQSQLNRDLTRLSFSIYIYVYVYILWDISPFNSGRRLIPLRRIQYQRIAPPFDRWNISSGDWLIFGRRREGEFSWLHYLSISTTGSVVSIAFRFKTRDSNVVRGGREERHAPPRLKQIFTEQLFTQRSETVTKLYRY